jgi:D-3-phosphoglycerate dehydrogenase / 2-oxoglutarate reductase
MKPALPRVLFIESVHPILDERLRENGFECDHLYTASRQEILSKLHEYTGVVIRSRVAIDEEFINHGKKLRFIARSGSGLENIDTACAHEKDIAVFNSPEGNSDAVGEHVTGMLLTLMNRLHLANQEVKQGAWRREENRGLEISGKTVALIGYGNMGSATARKLSGFGCKIIAYDKYVLHTTDPFTALVPMETVWREADIVSLHLPLTEETRYFANRAFFDQFEKPIWFVNTARGKNTDTAALVEAMRSGKVKGACLDVLEYEKASLEGLETSQFPAPLNWLMQSDRTILTPHVAGWTQESYVKLSSVLADKILAWWEMITD